MLYRRDETCDHCKDALAQIGQLMTSEQSIKDITLLLTGNGFCGSLSIPEAVAPCQSWTEEFMPKALPVLADYIADYAIGACSVEFQVC